MINAPFSQDFPTQDNNFDCGVYICQYAKQLLAGDTKPFKLCFQTTKSIRQIMAEEIKQKKIVEEAKKNTEIPSGTLKLCSQTTKSIWQKKAEEIKQKKIVEETKENTEIPSATFLVTYKLKSILS